MLNSSVVTLNPSAVMLNEVKHLKVNFVKSLSANSVNHLRPDGAKNLFGKSRNDPLTRAD
jgi:hypothetical protein